MPTAVAVTRSWFLILRANYSLLCESAGNALVPLHTFEADSHQLDAVADWLELGRTAGRYMQLKLSGDPALARDLLRRLSEPTLAMIVDSEGLRKVTAPLNA